MPRGAIADPIEQITPKERRETLSGYTKKALLWSLWDYRHLLALLFGGSIIVSRYILGPIVDISGWNLFLLTLLSGILLAIFSPPGRALRAKGHRISFKRRIWREWIDFCEDAECAVGPSGNRRAPYLLRRPTLKRGVMKIDVQRLQGTTDDRLENLAGQLQRFFGADASRVIDVDGPVQDAAQLQLFFGPGRRGDISREEHDDWTLLGA